MTLMLATAVCVPPKLVVAVGVIDGVKVMLGVSVGGRRVADAVGLLAVLRERRRRAAPDPHHDARRIGRGRPESGGAGRRVRARELAAFERRAERLHRQAGGLPGAERSGVDVVVVNHGIWPAEEVPVAAMDDARWHRTMREDLDSVFWLSRAAARARSSS